MKICFYFCHYQNQNFSLVSHSCCLCSTRVALESFVLHSCCSRLTRVALVSLVPHSRCVLVASVALMSLMLLLILLLLLLLLLLSIYFIWQDVKILHLKYLHNRRYTKNGMLIKVNKLKLIWNNVKERKSYNNVVKKISG